MFLIEFLIKPERVHNHRRFRERPYLGGNDVFSVDMTKIRFGYIKEDDHPNV